MTCIVAIAKDGVVYMGGDRLISAGQTTYIGGPKIYFVKNNGKRDFLFGDAGAVRAGNLLKSIAFEMEECYDDPVLTLVNQVVTAIREIINENGAVQHFDDGTDAYNNLLIGYRGRLFHVDSALGVTEPIDGYFATGSGGDFALGSLATTNEMDISPKDRLRMALEASEKHHCYVSRPFDFLELGP